MAQRLSEPISGVRSPLYKNAEQAHKSKESGNEYYGLYQFGRRRFAVVVLSVCLHVDHLFSVDRHLATKILQLDYIPMKVF